MADYDNIVLSMVLSTRPSRFFFLPKFHWEKVWNKRFWTNNQIVVEKWRRRMFLLASSETVINDFVITDALLPESRETRSYNNKVIQNSFSYTSFAFNARRPRTTDVDLCDAIVLATFGQRTIYSIIFFRPILDCTVSRKDSVESERFADARLFQRMYKYIHILHPTEDRFVSESRI